MMIRAFSLLALVATIASPGVADACTPKRGAVQMGRTVVLDTSQPSHHGSINHGETGILKKGEVIITFDDGPIPQRTRPILDSLDRHCVKATFFAVGRMAMAYPDTLREVVRRGHTLAGHTWSHANLGRTGLSGGRNEVERGFAALEAITGRPASSLFRFPYLSTSRVLLAELTKANVGSISVDVVSGDTDGYSAEKMLRVTMERLRARGNGILLFHDIKKETVRAVPMILDALAAEGYKVVHLKTRAPYQARADLVAEYRRILDKRAPLVADAGVSRPTPTVALPVRRTTVAAVAETTGGGSFFSFASASIASEGSERAKLALDRESRELPAPTRARPKPGEVARTEEGTAEAGTTAATATSTEGTQAEPSRVAALAPTAPTITDLPARRQQTAAASPARVDQEPIVGSLPRRRPASPDDPSSGIKANKPDEAADRMPPPVATDADAKPEFAVAPVAPAAAAKHTPEAGSEATNEMPGIERKRPAIVLGSPTLEVAKPADEMPAEPLSHASVPESAAPSVATTPAGSTPTIAGAPVAGASEVVRSASAPATAGATTSATEGAAAPAAASGPGAPGAVARKPAGIGTADPMAGASKKPAAAAVAQPPRQQGAGERVTTARRTPATTNAALPRNAQRGVSAATAPQPTAPDVATTRAAKATAALRRKRAEALRRAALQAEQEQLRRASAAIEARRRAAAAAAQAELAKPPVASAPASAPTGGGQTELQKIWQREPFRTR
ncbi:MAG: polysaccharide deacetylase family protein [Rhizobiales bacterium]|nr:polysaccharide deacetylase family protein [Hyphomicrobiales bacterium]